MAVTEKTRKLLWARSGNRCAICRKELTVDATQTDNESIVGEECHVVSSKPNGPRYNPFFPNEETDNPNNLILLCRTHHKMVDDQPSSYSADQLLSLKVNHEKWVSVTLQNNGQPAPVRIRRSKNKIPSFLVEVNNGTELFSAIHNSSAFNFHNDEPKSEEDVGLLSDFFQELQDWGDLSSILEAGDQVRTKFRLTQLLDEIRSSGYKVFAGKEFAQLEGGYSDPMPFDIAIVYVLQKDNPAIIKYRKNKGETKGL
ncbi:MAG: HNH endonuclease signature motif containing protein [Anaerolineales bacterium]